MVRPQERAIFRELIFALLFDPPLRDRALINELGLREVEVRADRRVIPACHVGMHASLATVILKQADR